MGSSTQNGRPISKRRERELLAVARHQAAAATRCARRSRRAGAAAPRRSRARPRACATTASPGAGRMRRWRSAGPCEPVAPRCGAYPGRRGRSPQLPHEADSSSTRRAALLLLATCRDARAGTAATGGSAPRRRPRVDRFDSAAAYGSCASRWSWARAPRARRASRRLARAAQRLAARRALPGGARRPAQRGRDGCPAAGRATSCSARTTTPRTSPASWAPTTARRARRWPSSWRARSSRARLRRTGRVRALRRRGEPARRRRTRSSRATGCGAARSRAALPGRPGHDPARLRGQRAADPARGLLRPGLWERLRAAARRVGAGRAFPGEHRRRLLDDHVPFLEQGVPSIDLIDFDFPCFHRRCDDLSAVSERSLDAHWGDRAEAPR